MVVQEQSGELDPKSTKSNLGLTCKSGTIKTVTSMRQGSNRDTLVLDKLTASTGHARGAFRLTHASAIVGYPRTELTHFQTALKPRIV